MDFLDSQGSGEKVAANLQNAVSRQADAVILTMADLRASRSIIQQAAKDGLPIFTVDSGWVPGDIVDVTTNNWDMSAKVSTFLLNSIGGKGNIIFLRMAEHHGTRKRGTGILNNLWAGGNLVNTDVRGNFVPVELAQLGM